MNNNLAITSSPHFRSPTTTRDIMRDVLVAMTPALAASVVFFGWRALLLCGICVLSSVLFEYLYRRLMKLNNTVGDLSAAVTGLLLAFNLPVTTPPWIAIIGCFAAVVVVKQLFGGIGKNFANPAVVGRIVIFISFASQMSYWVLPRALRTADAVSGPTPLEIAAVQGLADAASAPTAEVLVRPTYLQMFLGNIGGCIGETCTLALLLGGIYLVLRRVITVTIPLAYIGTAFLFSWICGADPLYQILAGGLVLGAIFMATDYVTTPTTEVGKLIFGVGCGIITVAIRQFASFPEGVSFAILLMNIATPHIDRLTTIRAFGSLKGGQRA